MRHPDDWQLSQSQERCGGNSTMTSHYVVVSINDDRVDEAEPLDGVGDLANLLFRMLVRIAPGWPELVEGY
jgi:hypothetical protein